MAMITHEELNSVWALKQRVDRERRRLTDLEVLAEAITPILDGMPHSKPIEYKVERLAVKSADCKSLINSLSEQLIQAKFELLNRLQTFNLSELQERVLSYHYVSCMKFKEIAKRIGYTNDYIRKLHAKALKVLGLEIDENEQFVSSIAGGSGAVIMD